MPAITLPDQSVRRFDGPVTGTTVAEAIGPGLARAALAMKLKLTKAIDTFIQWLGDSDDEIKRMTVVTLQGITGQAFGADPAQWDAWWQTAKPK